MSRVFLCRWHHGEIDCPSASIFQITFTLLILAGETCENRFSDSETARSPEDAPEEVEQHRVSVGSPDIVLGLQQHTSLEAINVAATPDLSGLEKDPVLNMSAENELFNGDALALDTVASYEPFIETDPSLIPGSADFDPALANWQNMSFSWNVLSPSGSNTSGILRHEEMWTFCDGTFVRGLEMTRTKKTVENIPLDPFVPIQAILWGWHTVDSRTRNHPAWVALRQIDEKVFGLWKSKPQKIALMYVCSLVMQVSSQYLVQGEVAHTTQYRVDPTPQNLASLPAWFRPREVLSHGSSTKPPH